MATPKYPNGFIPRSELVQVERGHVATRGTAARWEALKADVLENEGVTLRITGEEENAYRSLAGQQHARKEACARGRCDDAAVPSYSSHGGSYKGRDSGAIDVANWAELGKELFYAYCRKHGFEPGFFEWEPWHIIDWNPYTVPTTTAKDEPMIPAILEIANNSAAAKSLYDLRTGKAIRVISKAENDAFRVAARTGAAIYIPVPLSEYKARGGK